MSHPHVVPDQINICTLWCRSWGMCSGRLMRSPTSPLAWKTCRLLWVGLVGINWSEPGRMSATLTNMWGSVPGSDAGSQATWVTVKSDRQIVSIQQWVQSICFVVCSDMGRATSCCFVEGNLLCFKKTHSYWLESIVKAHAKANSDYKAVTHSLNMAQMLFIVH